MFNIYANRYAPLDPLVPPCEINLIPIGYVGEDQVRCLVFDLTDCVQKLGEGTFQISFVRPGDNACYICTNVQRLDDNAIWVITDTDTAYEGYGLVQLMYFPANGGTAKTAQYRTTTFKSNGEPGDAPDPYEGLLEQIAQLTSQAVAAASTATAAADQASAAVESGISTERSQRIAADEDLQVQITSLMGAVGGPLTAATAAAMTDTSKVYVYVGNESGYTYGHWYYYAGANWADGGVYNSTALETDKTLTVEGMAADAAACGDLKSQIYSAFVTESITDSAIASFDDGADDVPVKDLVVNITPKQAGSGDPSPSNVRAITGFTAANITRTGRNLLKYNIPTYPGLTITENADGSFHVSGKPTNNGSIYLWNNANNPIIVPEGATYYWGWNLSNQATIIMGTANEPLAFQTSYNMSKAINAGAYVACRIYVNSANTYDFDFKPIISIDGDGTFEKPTDNDTYNISFGIAGTVYGGTLDVTSGMLTVTHAIIDTSTLTWTDQPTNYRYLTSSYGVPNASSVASLDTKASIWAEQKQTYSVRQLIDSNGTLGGIGQYLTYFYWYYTNDAKTTPSGNMVYQIAQPVSVQLSAQDIRTLLGNNNIWSDTGSVESCEYRADTGILITKLTNAIISLGGNI